MNIDAIKSSSSGRWLGIFQSLGIEVPMPPGQHGPCPIERSGTDRFRLDRDSAISGTWFCGQCSPHAGDGISLVQRALGLSFVETLERISEVVGMVSATYPDNKPKKDPKIALTELWKNSKKLVQGDPVTKYLQSRSIVMVPNDVRFCPSCYNSDTKTKMPAMISLVRNSEGKGVSIHRTYLDGDKKADVASPKKMMPATEPLVGSAIRLFPVGDDGKLGIAEGIETAISAYQLSDIPTWSVISTSLMESFVPPPEAKIIVIFSDNDANFSGQKAAYRLANKLYSSPHNRIVDVQIPDLEDWNDMLTHQARMVQK